MNKFMIWKKNLLKKILFNKKKCLCVSFRFLLYFNKKKFYCITFSNIKNKKKLSFWFRLGRHSKSNKYEPKYPNS